MGTWSNRLASKSRGWTTPAGACMTPRLPARAMQSQNGNDKSLRRNARCPLFLVLEGVTHCLPPPTPTYPEHSLAPSLLPSLPSTRAPRAAPHCLQRCCLRSVPWPGNTITTMMYSSSAALWTWTACVVRFREHVTLICSREG